MAAVTTLVMTLLVRDEEDILDAHIGFHLSAGVDFVIATDHGSRDGTGAVLERYANEGVLHVLRESGPEFRQPEWVTRMARLAAVEYGADWVINSDADEFWWPSGGNLKQVLARTPDDYGVVRTFVRPFLPRPGYGPFAERMTVRLTPTAAINDPSSSFKVNVRLAHRATAGVVVGRGNASVRAPGLRLFPGTCALDVLHFPMRSLAQFRRKFLDHYATVGGRRGDHARAFEAEHAGLLPELYERICIDDDRLRRGLADGSLAVDTRLRDALRRLAADPGVPLAFPRRTRDEEAAYVDEAALLDDGELLRLQRRVDELARRVESLDRGSA